MSICIKKDAEYNGTTPGIAFDRVYEEISFLTKRHQILTKTASSSTQNVKFERIKDRDGISDIKTLETTVILSLAIVWCHKNNETNRRRNKQTTTQTEDETNKLTNKLTNKQANKQTNNRTN